MLHFFPFRSGQAQLARSALHALVAGMRPVFIALGRGARPSVTKPRAPTGLTPRRSPRNIASLGVSTSARRQDAMQTRTREPLSPAEREGPAKKREATRRGKGDTSEGKARISRLAGVFLVLVKRDCKQALDSAHPTAVKTARYNRAAPAAARVLRRCCCCWPGHQLRH